MADNEMINEVTGTPALASQGLAEAYAGTWGANGVFTPGIPLPPFSSADEKPRVFDYQSGINLYLTPRTGYGLMPFAQLKNFSDMSDAVRIVIEAVKREIRSLDWDIQNADPTDNADYSSDIEQLRAFWRKPDGFTEFDGWCNAVLEDMLVYDAVSLWLDQDGSGNVLAVEQIDGSTIRPLLDARGRIPRAPVPAYMQMIKGRNWQWFSADRLLYRPFNTSASSPYGRSPIEFLILRINESLRRQNAATTYWDTTNVPEAFAFLPADWTTDQISQFQDYIDGILAGNVEKLRRIKFLPSPGSGQPVYEFRRPDAEASNAFDEFMLRMTCYAFGFLPSELGLVPGEGLGGAGFMAGQENSMYRFGIGPITQYLQNLFTGIVQRQTKSPLVWRFVNIGPQEDKTAAASLMQMQLQNGVIDINTWRAKEGQPAIPNAKPFIVIAGMPVMLEDLFKPGQPATSQDDAIDQAGQPVEIEAESTPADKPESKPEVNPVAGDATAEAAASAGTVQATALNGAQIASLSEIVQLVSGGTLPFESAVNLVQVAFPTITPDVVQRILGPARGFTPATAEKTEPPADVEETPPEFVKIALDHWREKSIRRMKDGKKPDCEPPAVSAGVIPPVMQKSIRSALALAGDVNAINLAFTKVPDPKGRALLKGEEHPTAGRRKIEDDMTDDLAAKLKLIASALEAGDRTQAEAVASEDPELWDAYIDAVADRQGKAGAKQEIPATPDTPGSPFWEQFIKILLPAVFGWLLASIQHGTSEARGKAGDAPGVIPPRIRAGVSWDVVNKAAEAWARANAGRLIKQLQGTTVEQIRKAVADWIEQGEALPALTKAINELIDDPRRARLIAQSETTNAFAAGNHMAWDAAGVWGNKWQSVQDEVVCPVCSRLVGQTRPIGSPFIDPLTDKQYERPGAHPGCRCYTIPVLEKPDGWDEATGLVA
jgi:hypothetical protein